MYATELPCLQYFDLAGAPLNAGYIYFGQPNQNPETAPISVFWDAAGTQPALQPVRTSNGLVVHNGAIANLFVVGNYSITVRDRNSALVFSAPTADRIIFEAALANSADITKGASMIGFDGTTLDQFFKSRSNRVVDSIAALKALDKTKYTRTFVTGYYAAGDGGGGAYWYDSTDTSSADNGGTIIVATDGGRWKCSLTSPVSVKQFGAKGDGATDDTAALLAFAAYFGTTSSTTSANGGRGRIPKGVYLTSQMITFQEPGINIEGDSEGATIIRVTANLGAGAAIKFTQNLANYSNLSVNLSNITIDMQGFTGHGLWMLKPYDGCEVKNVFSRNVGDAYSAFRVEPNPNNIGDPVTQSVVFDGCEGAHLNSTATAAVWFLDSVQEAQLIGCKGFAWYGGPALSPCAPFFLQNCRGITFLGCSSYGTSSFGIYITTTTRNSTGIQIIGHSYESCSQFMACVTVGANIVSEVHCIGLRNEGSGSTSVEFVLTGAQYCKLDTETFKVTLDANSKYNVITSRSATAVTNSGPANAIIFVPSVTSPNWQLVADDVVIGRTDGTSSIEVAPGQVNLSSSGSIVMEASYPFTINQAGALLAINRAGTVTLSRVTIGAVDSGGVGFKLLCVPN